MTVCKQNKTKKSPESNSSTLYTILVENVFFLLEKGMFISLTCLPLLLKKIDTYVHLSG